MIKVITETINEMKRKSKKVLKPITNILKINRVTPNYGAPAHVNFTSNVSPASKVLIYKSELEYISRCIMDYTDIETGGQLFGYWTSDGVPVVLYAIGPGPYANHQGAFFNQDVNYLETVKAGDEIIITSRLAHAGRRTVNVNGQAAVDGMLCATADAIFYKIG